MPGDALLETLQAQGLIDAASRAQVEAFPVPRRAAVLVALGLVESRVVARTLADLDGLPFLDLEESGLQTEALDIDVRDLIRDGWLPLGPGDDGRPRVAVTAAPSDALVDRIERAVGADAVIGICDAWEFREAVLERHGHEVAQLASLGLWGRSPRLSARNVLVTWQKIALAIALVLLAVAIVLHPREVAIVISLLVGTGFLLATSFKFFTSFTGSRMERRPAPAGPDLPDADLPRYTVLVPVFREANIVAQLIGNLGRLDYPVDLLEVLILVEENDDETRAAAMAADPPPHFRFVTVPAGQPQTKPKACNVGLELATGEYLVIYDAEDRPDPDQLRKAIVAFREGPEELVCVQAALNYFNVHENFLTRMFTLEYSFWFDYMLPGLDEARFAIPLGGTSNHFKVDALRELGGWDPFNVTEDADLGIRASAEGMRVGVIDSTTFEEANTSVPNFIRQRSRWIKGYLQTTLVHLRNPLRLVRVAGLRQALSFLLLVGGTPLTFLAVPFLYALFVMTLVVSPHEFSELFPGWVLWLSLFNLGVGNALMIYVSMMGAFKRRQYLLVPWAVLNPFYWILHSIAAYKALWQLIVRPHYWEKTDHGLTGVDHTTAVAPAAG